MDIPFFHREPCHPGGAPIPVNRRRRALFAFAVVAFALGMMAYMGVYGGNGHTAETALNGFRDIGLFVALTYLGGSTVDYSSSVLAHRLGINTDKGDDDDDDDGKDAGGDGKIGE